ncbi:hypothetical protein Taro_032354, partial [Colocasia esculenta]|nr:hypothetical protein [Colocasia esculenta]
MDSKGFIAEGHSINRPPFFNGTDYSYWKNRIQVFLRAQNYEIWKVVEVGPYENQGEEDTWTREQIRKATLNYSAMNMIQCAVHPKEYSRISMCKSAKEMWDKLELLYEGTSQVKETKANILLEIEKQEKQQKIEEIVTLKNQLKEKEEVIQTFTKGQDNLEVLLGSNMTTTSHGLGFNKKKSTKDKSGEKKGKAPLIKFVKGPNLENTEIQQTANKTINKTPNKAKTQKQKKTIRSTQSPDRSTCSTLKITNNSTKNSNKNLKNKKKIKEMIYKKPWTSKTTVQDNWTNPWSQWYENLCWYHPQFYYPNFLMYQQNPWIPPPYLNSNFQMKNSPPPPKNKDLGAFIPKRKNKQKKTENTKIQIFLKGCVDTILSRVDTQPRSCRHNPLSCRHTTQVMSTQSSLVSTHNPGQVDTTFFTCRHCLLARTFFKPFGFMISPIFSCGAVHHCTSFRHQVDPTASFSSLPARNLHHFSLALILYLSPLHSSISSPNSTPLCTMVRKLGPHHGARSSASSRPVPAEVAVEQLERRTKRRNDSAEQPRSSSAAQRAAKRGRTSTSGRGSHIPNPRPEIPGNSSENPEESSSSSSESSESHKNIPSES